MINGDKQVTCDGCGEEWEESFFCEACSSESYLEENMTPVLDWVGIGPEYEMTEEVVLAGRICFNCCHGHPSPPSPQTRDKPA